MNVGLLLSRIPQVIRASLGKLASNISGKDNFTSSMPTSFLLIRGLAKMHTFTPAQPSAIDWASCLCTFLACKATSRTNGRLYAASTKPPCPSPTMTSARKCATCLANVATAVKRSFLVSNISLCLARCPLRPSMWALFPSSSSNGP